MPKALRIFSYLLLTGILILGGGTGYLWWNKEVIIDRSIERINKELNAPISVGSIDLDLFSGFPRVRVELVDVEIQDALRPNTALLQPVIARPKPAHQDQRRTNAKRQEAHRRQVPFPDRNAPSFRGYALPRR